MPKFTSQCSDLSFFIRLFIIASFFLPFAYSTPSMGLGVNEFALTGRDRGGNRVGEVVILRKPYYSTKKRVSLCGKTYYVSSYAVKKVNEWTRRGALVTVEYRGTSNRRVLCNLK